MTQPTQDEIIAYNRAEYRKKRQYKDSMRNVAIGWIGIILTVAICLLLAHCNPATAQTVYEVKYESQADLKVFEVKYPSQADIKYFIVPYKSQASEQRHHWYYVQYPSQAKLKIYWVRYESQADRKVYRVQYASQTR